MMQFLKLSFFLPFLIALVFTVGFPTVKAKAYSPSEANVEDICDYAYERAVEEGFDGEVSELGVFGFCYNETDPAYTNAGWIYAIDLRHSPDAYIHYLGARQAQVVFGTETGVYYYAQVGDLLNYNQLTYQDVSSPSIGFNRVDYDDNFLFTNMPIDSNETTGIVGIGSFAPSFGSVESISDAGLIYRLYDISFYVNDASTTAEGAADLIGNTYPCVVTSVRDNSGYNLVSLQCPSLQGYEGVCFYGQFRFVPKVEQRYYFRNLSFALGTKKVNAEDLEDTTPHANVPLDEFYCLVVGQDTITSNVFLTVDDIKFFAYNRVEEFRNHTLTVFDYSEDNLRAPPFTFYAVGSINMYSPGSFILNFRYSSIYDAVSQRDLTDDEIAELSEEGFEQNQRQKAVLGYTPTYSKSYAPDTSFNADFSFTHEWSAMLSDVMDMFFQPFIITAVVAMLSVALIAYAIFGKR